MKTKIFLAIMSILATGLITVAQNYIKIDATFFSEALQEDIKIDIYLPPDYFINFDQDYATIYYLHGMGGNENEGNTDAMYYYNFRDTSSLAPAAIFVCMDASCEPYRGSMYLNSELYGPYEDYFMHDVIGFIEENFRAIRDRNFRFITGWSMGGFGASKFCVTFPNQFRGCIPAIGFLSVNDVQMETFKDLCYQEQGTYNLTYTTSHAKILFTVCGGNSPNMDIEPYYIEIPFDTLGNWVDTVLDKWNANDPSRYVKNLPDEHELSWFLIAGKSDHMGMFETYKDFTDSLDHYNIKYDTCYFDGGHEYDLESWIKAIPWIDSLINLSFSTYNVPIYTFNDLELMVYPNPARDFIRIKCLQQVTEVRIFSISGQEVGYYKGETEIELSGMSPGIYILEARTDLGAVREKFIKR